MFSTWELTVKERAHLGPGGFSDERLNTFSGFGRVGEVPS